MTLTVADAVLSEASDLANNDQVYIARAPVRIDIAGGWSDTPPICYQSIGGSVLNVAVRIDGACPVACSAQIKRQRQSLRLMSLMRGRSDKSKDEYSREEVLLDVRTPISLPLRPSDRCSLILACLVALGWPHRHASDKEERKACPLLPPGCGIEVISCSSLPAGSGMGGSSVIAAAVLSAMGKCLSLDVRHDRLIDLVNTVEMLYLSELV